MTERQEKITLTALELFAKNGFSGTSTAKISKAAGVSEALIFKHFKTKQGLLESIMELAHDTIAPLIATIVEEQDPLKVIHKIIEFPQVVLREQGDFWKLILSIEFNSPAEMCCEKDEDLEQLYAKTVEALTRLNHPNPAQEAEQLLVQMEGLGMIMIKEDDYESKSELIKYMQSKYTA